MDIVSSIQTDNMNKDLCLSLVKTADNIAVWIFSADEDNGMLMMDITKKQARQMINNGIMFTWNQFSDGKTRMHTHLDVDMIWQPIKKVA